MSIAACPSSKELIVGTQAGNIYRVLAYWIKFRATLENMILTESHTAGIVDVAVRAQVDLFATIDDQSVINVWSFENLQVISKLMP